MRSPDHIDAFLKRRTPFYHYDMDLLRQTLERVQSSAGRHGYHVHYALKANSNAPILDEVKRAGLGADCVSGNEIKQALGAGFAPSQIVFAGVGKSDEEIEYALDHDIFCFNCESVQEIEVINQLAERKGTIARLALRINPDVDAHTHKYVTTGLSDTKFGIRQWEFEAALSALQTSAAIVPIGLHFHIGSQITDLEVFERLCIRVNEIQEWFQERDFPIQHLNLGGGLGIDYENPDGAPIPEFERYFDLISRHLDISGGPQVHFELGRAIVGQCGNLISKVLFVKKGMNTNFAILDAGMTELIRPALYQSYHKIENLSASEGEEFYDVVGPVCESSDCFGKSIALPQTSRGDLIAIRSAGAYGQIMASGYNLRNAVSEVYTEE